MNLDSVHIDCPYCGERIEIVVDTSVEEQEYIEDCFVCCRPIILTVGVGPEGPYAFARSENE